jgi:hypothetical protein
LEALDAICRLLQVVFPPHADAPGFGRHREHGPRQTLFDPAESVFSALAAIGPRLRGSFRRDAVSDKRRMVAAPATRSLPLGNGEVLTA